jgi:Domain of unknown function (DUF397)
MAARHPDLSRAVWRKSARSSSTGQNCVEIAANFSGTVAMRDSKNPERVKLVLTSSAWTIFIQGVKAADQLVARELGQVLRD